MLIPPARSRGWKVTTIGDDIAWIKPGADGKLYAINPEAGYFGVAPGTNEKTNPNCMASLKRDAIFTNVALTDDGDVWWEGMTDVPPAHLIDWQGKDWTPAAGHATPAPRRRTRMRASRSRPPTTRRSTRRGIRPTACRSTRSSSAAAARRPCRSSAEARDWTEGVYMAATMGSETTAAAAGAQGVVRRDPFAMLPFIGYNMSDYFQHWLDLGATLVERGRHAAEDLSASTGSARAPTASSSGPATARTCACCDWIVERVEGTAGGELNAFGMTPRYDDLDWSGLDFDSRALRARQQHRCGAAWAGELALHDELFRQLAHRLPAELPRSARADRGAAGALSAGASWRGPNRRRRRARRRLRPRTT